MAKGKIKKGDIVRIKYDAYIAEGDVLYDTTDEEKAKGAGFHNEGYVYAPMPYVVGSGGLYPAIEAALDGAEVGKEFTVEVPKEEGPGERDPKLVEVHPAREFHKMEINPYPGLEVTLGNRRGTVVSVAAGRVKVDFNNPLAGKDLRYVMTATEIIKGDDEKLRAIVESSFGTSEGFGFEVTEDKAIVTISDMAKFNEAWLMAKFRIVGHVREILDVDSIDFVENWVTKRKEEGGTGEGNGEEASE
ncbi:MAG: peptidylprolyl isomerase [Thermoplasmatales archaeon]|nr:peptidylprolyl isomerase [Thermoplasmatales archaeon]